MAGQRNNWRQYGAMSNVNADIVELDRINLRLSGQTFQAIDAARALRVGRISRNTWIAEAVQEKLARDSLDADAVHLNRAHNA